MQVSYALKSITKEENMLCDPENLAAPDSGPYVHIVHIFAASPEKLFDAWLQPDLLRRWMSFTGSGAAQHGSDIHDGIGNHEGVGVHDVIANHRAGGLFWIREYDGSAVRDRYGEYQSIERPRRLVFSLYVPDRFPGGTCVNVSIAPSPNGSVMSFIQTGVHKDSAEPIWRTMFDRLTAALKTTNSSRI